VDAADSAASKRAPVLIPMAAAMSGDLPAVCALTGDPTTGRWIRKLGRRISISIPIREELLADYEKRTRAARTFMLGFFLAWILAVLLAIPAANAPNTSPLGPVAAMFFVMGLPLFTIGVVLLAKMTGTIPLRWRVVIGENGARYIRIGNPSRAFVEALDTHLSTAIPSVKPHVRVSPATRTHLPVRWEVLVPYATTVLALFVFFVGKLSSSQIPALIIAAALLVAVGFVAASVRWRIHIGSVFILTPLNAVIIVLTAAVASALGLIIAIDPQHGSAGGEAVAGISSAAIAVVAVVIVESIWRGVRLRIRRTTGSARDDGE